jgi:hypothetical protein
LCAAGCFIQRSLEGWLAGRDILLKILFLRSVRKEAERHALSRRFRVSDLA